jgi:hypothetical protein
MNHYGSRAKRLAGGSPLERWVRPRLSCSHDQGSRVRQPAASADGERPQALGVRGAAGLVSLTETRWLHRPVEKEAPAAAMCSVRLEALRRTAVVQREA